MSQYIDPQSIYTHFPENKLIPQRLIELLDWLSAAIDDEIGWFPEFTGETLDWYLPPIDLSPYFGVFANLGDGSLLAYWFYEECDSCNPPIVIFCIDGDLGVVAGSIEELIARIIGGKFPDTCWVDRMVNFYLHGDSAWIKDLEEWAEEVWSLTTEARQKLIVS